MRILVAFLSMVLVANFALAELQNSFDSFNPSAGLNVSGKSVGGFSVVSDDSGAAAELAMAGCDLNGPAGSGGGATNVVTSGAPINYESANVVDSVSALVDSAQFVAYAGASNLLDSQRNNGGTNNGNGNNGGNNGGTNNGGTNNGNGNNGGNNGGTNNGGGPNRPAVSPEPSTMLVVGLGLAFGALPVSRRLRRKSN